MTKQQILVVSLLAVLIGGSLAFAKDKGAKDKGQARRSVRIVFKSGHSFTYFEDEVLRIERAQLSSVAKPSKGAPSDADITKAVRAYVKQEIQEAIEEASSKDPKTGVLMKSLFQIDVDIRDVAILKRGKKSKQGWPVDVNVDGSFVVKVFGIPSKKRAQGKHKVWIRVSDKGQVYAVKRS